MLRSPARWFAAAALALAATSALAEGGGKIEFKNGDVVTGKVTQAADGSLTLVPDFAPGTKIVVPLDQVKTFASSEPVKVVMKDGTSVQGPASAAPEAGKVNIGGAAAGGGMAPGGIISLGDIDFINPNPNAGNWTGDVRAGGIFASGNTESVTASVAATAVKRSKFDRITANGEWLYGNQTDPATGTSSTSQNNWFISGKYDYFFVNSPKPWDKLYVFVTAKLERDEIANLSLRFSPAAGLGYQWIESKKMNFQTEAGLGWTYEDFKGQSSDSFFSARLAYAFDWKIVDNLKLFHTLEFLPSIENASKFNLNTDVGIRADITDNFFTETKFTLKHNSEPANNRQKNDYRVEFLFGWKF